MPFLRIRIAGNLQSEIEGIAVVGGLVLELGQRRVPTRFLPSLPAAPFSRLCYWHIRDNTLTPAITFFTMKCHMGLEICAAGVGE